MSDFLPSNSTPNTAFDSISSGSPDSTSDINDTSFVVERVSSNVKSNSFVFSVASMDIPQSGATPKTKVTIEDADDDKEDAEEDVGDTAAPIQRSPYSTGPSSSSCIPPGCAPQGGKACYSTGPPPSSRFTGLPQSAYSTGPPPSSGSGFRVPPGYAPQGGSACSVSGSSNVTKTFTFIGAKPNCASSISAKPLNTSTIGAVPGAMPSAMPSVKPRTAARRSGKRMVHCPGCNRRYDVGQNGSRDEKFKEIRAMDSTIKKLQTELARLKMTKEKRAEADAKKEELVKKKQLEKVKQMAEMEQRKAQRMEHALAKAQEKAGAQLQKAPGMINPKYIVYSQQEKENNAAEISKFLATGDFSDISKLKEILFSQHYFQCDEPPSETEVSTVAGTSISAVPGTEVSTVPGTESPAGTNPIFDMLRVMNQHLEPQMTFVEQKKTKILRVGSFRSVVTGELITIPVMVPLVKDRSGIQSGSADPLTSNFIYIGRRMDDWGFGHSIFYNGGFKFVNGEFIIRHLASAVSEPNYSLLTSNLLNGKFVGYCYGEQAIVFTLILIFTAYHCGYQDRKSLFNYFSTGGKSAPWDSLDTYKEYILNDNTFIPF